MDPTTRSARLQELFAAAIVLDTKERADLLASLSSDDAGLRAELEELLDHHARSGALLAHPAYVADERANPLPERIGAFRVLRVLGAGGMGVVYLAEQDHPRRLVALKVLLPGLASPRTLKRFEREAQALALLSHPGIASIHETGTADWGAGPQPYFAMEYVDGRRLSDAEWTRTLAVRERVELLAQICDALEHAHERGVIHRDLKPSNVLVEQASGRLRARVLDFGIARVTDSDLRATSLHTATGQVLGTLAYMSPEQASGDSEGVDRRADVYSLGVIGYELLSGRLPLDVVGKPLHEAVRTVRDDDPTPLSRAEPALRGDLETIFARALEKDAARRYPTAAALSADLRSYLEDRPIMARPTSRAYLIAKFARRNRVLVGGVAAVTVALAAGLAGTAWQGFVAAAERDRAKESARKADAEARRANSVARFQRDMLSRVKPTRDGREVKLLDVLDTAAAVVDTTFADDPAGAGAVHGTLGDSYDAIGALAEAAREYEAAAACSARVSGADSDEVWNLRHQLGRVRLKLDQVAAAEGDLRDVLERYEKVFGFEDLRTLSAAHSVVLLELRLRDPAAAAALASRVLEARRRVHGSERRELGVAVGQLGSALWQLGRLEEAQQALEEALAIEREVRGPNDPGLGLACSLLANVLRDRGELARAEELYREAVGLGRRLLGEQHHDLWVWTNNLAGVLEQERKFGEAEPLYREVLQRRMAEFGDDHEQTLIVLNNLAMVLTNTGRHAEAEPLHERALAIKVRVLGPGDRSTLTSRFNVGLSRLLQGRLEAALPEFRECAERAPEAYPAGHWMIAKLRDGYGSCLHLLGRWSEAEPVLLEAHAQMRAVFPVTDVRVRAIAERLSDLYAAWGKPEEAARWMPAR